MPPKRSKKTSSSNNDDTNNNTSMNNNKKKKRKLLDDVREKKEDGDDDDDDDAENHIVSPSRKGGDSEPASMFDVDADREKFKKGTLKREAYEMLEKHWPEMKDTNELWEQGLREKRSLGKSKAVLASGLSHDAVFVRVPGGASGSTATGKWALRCFVGQSSKKMAAVAASGGSGQAAAAAEKKKADDSSDKPKASGTIRSVALKGPSSGELLSKVQVLVAGNAKKTQKEGKEEEEEEGEPNDDDDDRKKSSLKLALKSNVARLSRATKDIGKAKERVERYQQTFKQLQKKESDYNNPAKRPKIEKLKTPAQFKKEAECPSLPKEFLKFTGNKNDRQALTKWNKGKEKAEEAMKSAVDAYVEKRRKEMRDQQALLKVDPKKMKSQINAATLLVDRAKLHLQACEDVIKALQVRKQIILESNIDDWEYTNKLAEFERLFLHIEKTKSESLEAVPDREKMRLLARAEAEEERVRLNEEKVRIKKIKAEESAQEREKAKADREAAKEEEKRKRIHEARYPIDDDDLREELIEESKEKGIELSALLRPLPKPVPVENGQVLADEGALAEFLAIFSEALTAPPLRTYLMVRECLENENKQQLYVLYRALLKGALHEDATGVGRGVTRLRSVNDNIVWAQVIVKLLQLEGERAHGKAAMEIVQSLSNDGARIDKLTLQQHLTLLRALADLALDSRPCHEELEARVQQADIYRAERFEERAKRSKQQKIREEKEKEKRRLKREADAMAKKELLEKQRLAREAGEPIPVSLEEEEEEEDLDAKFALPEEFQKYTGSELDRSAFVKWKKNREEALRVLAEQRRLYEAEKLKQERERKRIEKAELMRGADGDAMRERKWQATLERYQAEDDMVRVRVRALGRDRSMSTYWFGVGGRTDAVYVQSFDGKWGKYDNLDQIDALNVALNVKGEREAALKHSLAKRADMIEDAFERIRKVRLHEEKEKDRLLALQLEQEEREKSGARPMRQKIPAPSEVDEAPKELILSPGSQRMVKASKVKAKLSAKALAAQKEFLDAYLAFDDYSAVRHARQVIRRIFDQVAELPVESIANETMESITSKQKELVGSGGARRYMDESYLSEKLLDIEQKLYEFQNEQFALAEEESDLLSPAPPELTKHRLEQLVLKHTDRDMRSWKMARSKLAAMLPQEVLDEAVEARRREMIEEHMKENAEENEDEDAVRAKMFEDFENDRLEEDVDDASIWKHPGYDKRRDAWRKTLLGESGTPLTPAVLAYCAKVFNDTIQTFLGEMHERLELRAAQDEGNALADQKWAEMKWNKRARCSAITKSGVQCKLPAMEGKSTCINHSGAANFVARAVEGAREEEEEEDEEEEEEGREEQERNDDDDDDDDERVPVRMDTDANEIQMM